MSLVLAGLALVACAAASESAAPALSLYGLRAVVTQSGSATLTWKLHAECTSCDPVPLASEIRWLDALGNPVGETVAVAGAFPPTAPVTGPDGENVRSYHVRVRFVSGAAGALNTDERWTPWVGATWYRVPGTNASTWGSGPASWICTSPESTDVRSSMLRSEFVLPAGRSPVSAVAHVVGLGQFQLRVNGAQVGGDANVPGWTTWAKRVLFSSYELPPGSLSAAPTAKCVGGRVKVGGLIMIQHTRTGSEISVLYRTRRRPITTHSPPPPPPPALQRRRRSPGQRHV